MKDTNNIRSLQINFAGKNLSGKALSFEKLLVKSFDSKVALDASSQQQCEQKLLLAASFDILKQQLMAEPRLVKKALENRKSGLPKFIAKNNLDAIIHDPKTLVNHFEALGFNTLIEAEQFVDNQASQRANYLWKLGRYCDESLHMLQEDTDTIKPNIDPVKYTNIVIRHYFEAMDLGHQEASNYFPRLLELIELYPETGETFKACVSRRCYRHYVDTNRLLGAVIANQCYLEIHQMDPAIGVFHERPCCSLHLARYPKISRGLSQCFVLSHANLLRDL